MYVIIKIIERWFDICMQDTHYQEQLKAFERLQLEEQRARYDEYFAVPSAELNDSEILGIAEISDSELLIFCEEEEKKYLLYNYQDEFYYINSSTDDSELMKGAFDTKEYEVVDNHLIVKKNDSVLSEFPGIHQYHINGNKDFEFNGNINEIRKEILVDKENVVSKANEDLAEKYKLPKSIVNQEMSITDIEENSNGKSTLTIEDPDTKKKEYLYADFNNSFTEEVKEKLSFRDSFRLMFEEIKNASAQMSMGFLGFYGARFDEEHLDYDPKVVLENGEYKVSRFNQDGTKIDLKSGLTKSNVDKELDNIIKQQRIKEQSLNRTNEISHELELKKQKNGDE